MLVGMAPGKEELKEGKPFVGSSGSLLRDLLRKLHVDFDDVYCINVINCWPAGKGDTISADQWRKCRPRFVEDLQAFKGQVVVPLGTDALRAVTGYHGTGHGISAWRGYVIRPDGMPVGPNVIAVVPTYHPSFVMRRGLAEVPVLLADLRRALRLARASRRGPLPLWSMPAPAAPQEFGDPPKLGIDIETGYGVSGITHIGLATANQVCSLRTPQEQKQAERLLASPHSLKIIHNGPFDIPRLEANGFRVKGPLWDTLLAAQRVDPEAGEYSLNAVSSYHIDMERWKHLPGRCPKPTKRKEWKTSFVCSVCKNTATTGSGVKDQKLCEECTRISDEEAVREWERAQLLYNQRDTAVLIPIQAAQESILKRTGQLVRFQHLMHVVRHHLIPCQIRGLRIDDDAKKECRADLESRQAQAIAKWAAIAGDVNPGSIPQLREFLYTTLGAPVQLTKDGRLSTDSEALHELLAESDDERVQVAVKTLLELRRTSKWINTYTNLGDRIYPAYGPVSKDTGGQMVAHTGRILAKGSINPDGSKTPPIQQIPEELRHMVIPEDGMLFVGADYSSQELRIVAWKSGCKRLIRQILNGEDIHAQNCVAFGCDRTRAKNIFYAWIFGGTAKSAQRALKMQGIVMQEATLRTYFATLHQLYPEIPEYHQKLLEEARTFGYIKTSWGSRRYTRDVKKLRNEILNYPIQGDGAEIGWEIIPLTDECAADYGGYISILLHDGFYWQIPADKVDAFVVDVRKIMEQEWPQIAPGFSIPVDIKTGPNWRDLK